MKKTMDDMMYNKLEKERKKISELPRDERLAKLRENLRKKTRRSGNIQQQKINEYQEILSSPPSEKKETKTTNKKRLRQRIRKKVRKTFKDGVSDDSFMKAMEKLREDDVSERDKIYNSFIVELYNEKERNEEDLKFDDNDSD